MPSLHCCVHSKTTELTLVQSPRRRPATHRYHDLGMIKFDEIFVSYLINTSRLAVNMVTPRINPARKLNLFNEVQRRVIKLAESVLLDIIY